MVVDLSFLPESLILLMSFILSAFPLHKAVKFFKGKNNFLKTLLIVFITGVIIFIISIIFKTLSSLIAFAVLILVYKKSFKLTLKKAFLVWVFQLGLITASSILISFLIEILSYFSVISV